MTPLPALSLAQVLDPGGIGLRLLIDLVAITILALGLFAAVVVISEGQVVAAVGFGLFAVLSIIRLRAEQLSFAEIAYCFAAIVVGLVTAIDLGGVGSTAALAALVLAAPAIIDQPGLLRASRRLEITLERTITDPLELRRAVEERLGARVVALEVLDLDYVREVTRVEVHIVDHARTPAAAAPDAFAGVK